MRISDFIASSNRTASPQALFDLLVQAANDEGFGQIAYAALTYHGSVDLAGNAAPAIALSYPAAWRQYYFERRYQEIDPILLLTPGIAGPFLWEMLRARYRLGRRECLLLDEAYAAGLRNGVTVPLHGPFGRVAAVSFASTADDADAAAQLGYLNALAAQFHVAFNGVVEGDASDGPVPQLSQRERECLLWIARGKSSWDIGVILKISENTVNFHIKNVMRKLGTTSRTVAVVKAIRYGLIDLY